MSADLLLSNARVVDGTGAPWFRGHVGVSDGRIERVVRGEPPDASADTTLDLDDAVVCPGFVDTHSKSDMEPFGDRTLSPKVRQGITTEIVGLDGYSMAPLYGDAAEWRSVLGGFARGLPVEDWTWGSFADYLDALESNGVAPNVGGLVGHGTVRFGVLGLDDREPTPGELEEMGDLVTESLEAGALGLSTGLVYPPQLHASTDELLALAKRLRPVGRPLASHVRSQGRWVWEAIDELHDVGAEAGVPVEHSHVQLSGAAQGGKADRALALFDAARERGIDLTANMHPYKAGSTKLSALLPPRFLSMPTEELVATLRDPDVREEIRRDVEEWRIDDWENLGGLTGWDDVVIASVATPANKDAEGRSLADLAAERGGHPIDVACDLMIEEEFDVDMLLHKLSEADIRAFLSDDRIAACTDGLFGDHPHPRTYGTFPRILGEYVHEANLLSLEEAVRKMTSLPARTFGLAERGLVRPSMVADLVVVRPESVAAEATYEEPTRSPRGVDHVIVGGEFVVRDGEITGEMPGEVLRAGRG